MTHSVLDAPISPLRQRLIEVEHAAFLTRDAAQLPPRHRTPGDIPWSLTRPLRPPTICAGSRSSSRRTAFRR